MAIILKMLRCIIIILTLSMVGGKAAIYETFPGFKKLYEKADFVGVVKLSSRDVPADPRKERADWIGPHRFFRIESKFVLKGSPVKDHIARLADRRLGTWEQSVSSIRNQEILATDSLFLVFLAGRYESGSARYQWDELHAEGAVLPVSPKTNLNALQYGGASPLRVIDTIVSDYTKFCRQLFEQAVIQETLIKQQRVCTQTAAVSEGLLPKERGRQLGEFKDPRHVISLYEWIEDGADIEAAHPINNSILIICWAPDPNGKFETYQISGIEGYHTRELVEKFLERFYALERSVGVASDPLNTIIVENNWAAESQLKETLRALSKKHSFTVFRTGGWGFRKAVLIEEPEARLRLIRKAFEESKSENHEKLKPESSVLSK